jgi:hypothetical protein
MPYLLSFGFNRRKGKVPKGSEYEDVRLDLNNLKREKLMQCWQYANSYRRNFGRIGSKGEIGTRKDLRELVRRNPIMNITFKHTIKP